MKWLGLYHKPTQERDCPIFQVDLYRWWGRHQLVCTSEDWPTNLGERGHFIFTVATHHENEKDGDEWQEFP